MPWDSVWVMEANKPTQKKITCTRAAMYFDDKKGVVISVHYSFDKNHEYFTPERNVAATKDELKEIIFG